MNAIRAQCHRWRVVALCALIGFEGCSRPANPAETIRSAYEWYVRTLKGGKNPFESQAQLRAFVTERFLNSIQYLRGDLDNSPFVEADSFDARLGIENTDERGETATARVILAGRTIGKHRLDVSLVREQQVWKIDDVKYLENTE